MSGLEELLQNITTLTPFAVALVAFAGLAWDDACLAFHEGRRPVQTLSRWQVRQPVHTRSVGRWRNYAQWFESASPSRPVEGAVARARVAQGFW